MATPRACKLLDLKLIRHEKRVSVYRSDAGKGPIEIVGERGALQVPKWYVYWHGAAGWERDASYQRRVKTEMRALRSGKGEFQSLSEACTWLTR